MTEQNFPLIKSIAILGGTGKEGTALAKRWAIKGYKVIIGSRTLEKAETVAAEVNEELEGDYVTGLANADAASEAGIIVLSVPYSAHAKTLKGVIDQVQGKILIDITVPLSPPDVSKVNIPDGGSAAQEAQALLGDGVRVVSAFQNVSYIKIKNPNTYVDCDVFVSGDDLDAKQEVITLIDAAGMRGIDIGSLANAVVAESLTSVLIYINKTYGTKSAGIRITGIE